MSSNSGLDRFCHAVNRRRVGIFKKPLIATIANAMLNIGLAGRGILLILGKHFCVGSWFVVMTKFPTTTTDEVILVNVVMSHRLILS